MIGQFTKWQRIQSKMITYDLSWAIMASLGISFLLHSPTARKNQPGSCRSLGQIKETLWRVLEWTSHIPLKVTFSSENYQDVIKSQLFIRSKH